jgi:hypothetical protein
VRFSEEELRTEKDDRVQQLLGTVDELRVEVVRLRTLLNRDHTGLAAALVDVVREASARLWVTDGRGSYEWDDDRYRREAGRALRAVIEVAKTALGESGKLADSAFHPERPTPPDPAMATNVAIRLRELADGLRSLMAERAFWNDADEAAWSEARKKVRGIGATIEALLPPNPPPARCVRDDFGEGPCPVHPDPSKTADQQARFVAPKFDLESVTRVDPRGHRWREFLLEDYSLGVRSWQECLCGAARAVELPEAVYGRATEFWNVLDEHPDRRRVSRGPHLWHRRLNEQSVAPCPIGESEWVRAEKLTAGGATRVAIDCALSRHAACSGQHCCCACHAIRLMSHEDGCGEYLDADGRCPKCGFHPDSTAIKYTSVAEFETMKTTGRTFLGLRGKRYGL